MVWLSWDTACVYLDSHSMDMFLLTRVCSVCRNALCNLARFLCWGVLLTVAMNVSLALLVFILIVAMHGMVLLGYCFCIP